MVAGAAASPPVLLAGRAGHQARDARRRIQRQADGRTTRRQSPLAVRSRRAAALRRLPAEPYAIGEWRIACTVNIDYHIALERNFYSVPFRLVHKVVDAFVTPTTVQIFYRSERVASHVRAVGRNIWTTAAEHMPPAHRAVANQTPDRIRAEAAKIGVATTAYVEHLLTGRDHIEQGVRSCLGILRLARQHPAERLEAACRWALAAGAHSSGFVEQLLKSRRAIPDPLRDDRPGSHDNVRGSDYYH